MSTEKQANEPAFPFSPESAHGIIPMRGMSKREYAAIQIMAGFAADPNTAHPDNGTIDNMSVYAVKWADSLLTELNKDK